MKNPDPKTSLSSITDGAEITESQLAAMRMVTLPRKVRLNVKRPSGWVQIQHVGEQLRVRQYTEYAFNTPMPDSALEEIGDICDAAMSRARWMLSLRRDKPAAYRFWEYGQVEITTSDQKTGREVLNDLDHAVAELLDEAHKLIRALAGGFRLVPGNDTDLESIML